MSEISINLAAPKQMMNSAIRVEVQRIVFEKGRIELGLEFFDDGGQLLRVGTILIEEAEYTALVQTVISNKTIGQTLQGAVKQIVLNRIGSTEA